MPGDTPQEFPATATVTTAAGGHLTLVAYTWQHPDDGPQDGLILIETGSEGRATAATWGDSWHQKPETMPLSAVLTPDGSVSLGGSYAGDWGWRIHLEVGHTQMRLSMENVVPAAHASDDLPAGPYPVMSMELSRA